MSRFILRYRGAGPMPAADLARIRGLPHGTVLDETSRMVLVELPDDDAAEVGRTLASWTLAPEREIPLPDPRPRVRRRVA